MALTSVTKHRLIAYAVVATLFLIVLFGVLYARNHGLYEHFIQLPDFGSTRNYLLSPSDLLAASGIPTGVEAVPPFTATDPSVEDISKLTPNFNAVMGKVIGTVPITKPVVFSSIGVEMGGTVTTSTTTTTLPNTDPNAKDMATMLMQALNAMAQPTTNGPALTPQKRYSLLMQGNTTLITKIDTTGIVKNYALDLFIYDIKNNFTPHIAPTVVADETTGKVTCINITFPDLTAAQTLPSMTPSDLFGSSIAGAMASPAFLSFGSFNPIQATAELPTLPQPPPNGANGSPAMCFGSFDVGATTAEACQGFGGVWDSPVTSDAECPFFQANKNYDNVLGGANFGGFCQLPSGMELIGYRYAKNDKTKQPLCYNCNGVHAENGSTVGPCCDDQATNKKAYPNLITPDFQYPGDGPSRAAGAAQLNALGLSIR